MKLKEFSVKKLKKTTRNKKIIIFGVGSNFRCFMEKYSDWAFEDRIDFIVDNSSKKWGQDIEINKKKFVIENPNILDKIDLKKYIILITPEVYESIFAQIQTRYINKKVVCTTLPRKIYSIEKTFEGVMRKLPLKNIILLRGEGDTCENAEALVEYIREQDYYSKCKIVWLCNHPDACYRNREIYIRWGLPDVTSSLKERLQYYYYINRAKIILFENNFIEKSRNDQVTVYLKHGEMPLKCTKGLIDLPDNLNFTIASSDFSASIISEQYSINRERILMSGTPRTDILFTKDIDNETIKMLETNKFSKTILWMPTFRKHSGGLRNDSEKEFYKGVPIINSDDDILKLISILKKYNVQLLIKPHKYQDLTRIQFDGRNYIKVLTQYEIDEFGINTHRIMRCVDALITDYSSVAFDFMLLDRPIGYTIDDLKEYKLEFVQDNITELMPGDKIETISEMENFIKNIAKGVDVFETERRRISKLVNELADGNSSKKVCRYLGLE